MQKKLNWKRHTHNLGQHWKIKFFDTCLKFQQCELSRKCVSNWFTSFLTVKTFRHHRIFFPTKSTSETSELCRKRTKNINFYEWSIKILVLRKTTVCFKTVLPRFLWAFSSVTKVCILFQCETNTHWKLHNYSVGWVWKFIFFDLCIEIATVRNIQWMRFWLIQFNSRSRTSSPPGDWFFGNRFYIGNIRFVKENKEELSNLSMDPSKS